MDNNIDLEKEKILSQGFTVYYDKKTGWIQENSLWQDPHTDESGSFEVDRHTWEELCQCPGGYRWKYQDGKPVLVEYIDDKNRELVLSGRLMNAYGELASTDFVVVKINEAMIEGDIEEAERLKVKYKDILDQRKANRKLINELEKFFENNN